jgi:hypothetical protein
MQAGPMIEDHRNGVRKHRLDVAAAGAALMQSGACSGNSATPSPTRRTETTPPRSGGASGRSLQNMSCDELRNGAAQANERARRSEEDAGER